MSNKITPPSNGQQITIENGSLNIPNHPVIPYISGDGIGPEVVSVMRSVLDDAVEKTFDGERSLEWVEVPAGESANEEHGEYLPDVTLDTIRKYKVAIKGPLTTPIGEGFRSLNVALRQKLDLYACVRPVYHISGIPSPMKNPEEMDMVIFRENTEDVYAGVEWEAGSDQANQLIEYLNSELDEDIRDGSALGLKPMSEKACKDLIRKAIQYAIDRDRESVTLVHKGNIMKFTEGAFRDWGYELAEEEFPEQTITEDELWEEYDGEKPDDLIVIKDRIADNMLQQLITRTTLYDVIATPNLNGDYISDAAAGQVGGLGVAPGGNLGDGRALFEPTHGSAPKYAGEDKVNPTSEILSGIMLLEYIGWDEVGERILEGIRKTVEQKTVTYDLDRQMDGATKVSTSKYGALICENM